MSVNAVDVGYHGLIGELSRVFNQRDEALHLAQRAGFPVADVPEFGTATVFWGRLVQAAEDGKLLGGVEAIVAQARLRFPHNPIFAARGSKTVIAPMQTGLRLVHAVDLPPAAAVPDPSHGAPWPHGAANHQPPSEVPAHPAAPPSAATSTNTNQSPFAPHLSHASPPTPQPIGPVTYTGRDARDIKIDARTKTDNRKGFGAAGVTSIVLVVGAALCTMGWLAFDAIKSMPRNSDGSVTVWGVFTLPAGVVGEAPPPEERDDEETKAESGPMTPPTAPTPAPVFATRKEIEGVWECRGNYTITFTDAGRAAFSHSRYLNFRETPFAQWTDQPYTIVSAKTIEVGGMPVQVEVSADGQTLRAAGGTKVFNCKRAVL